MSFKLRLLWLCLAFPLVLSIDPEAVSPATPDMDWRKLYTYAKSCESADKSTILDEAFSDMLELVFRGSIAKCVQR